MEWDAVEQAIQFSLGESFRIKKTFPVGGGCINSAYRIMGDKQEYFIKANRRELVWIFEAEAQALKQILATDSVKTPLPVAYGNTENMSFLVLEWISLRSRDSSCDRLLGHRLAQMHRKDQPYFGWERENAIGSTIQMNVASEDWIEFWKFRRLLPQFRLAAENGYGGKLQRKGEVLCDSVQGFFAGYSPCPSLLHGDLWAGNYARNESGSPVIFDPATYYGDRETDIAMTELFGGFGTDFYAAYNESFPLDRGYIRRKNLYNLYHILNHLNLFGGGYLSQAQSMIDSLLAELT